MQAAEQFDPDPAMRSSNAGNTITTSCALEVLMAVFPWASTRIKPQISGKRKIEITQSLTNVLSVILISLEHCFGKRLTNCKIILWKGCTE